MRYFSSPYKRAQAALITLDALVALSIFGAAIYLYPHNTYTLSLIVWPCLLFGTLFIVGAYDLAARRHRVGLVSRLTAAAAVSTLAVYPILEGPDRERIRFVVVVFMSISIVLYLLRRILVNQTSSILNRRAAFFLATANAANRLAECDDLIRKQYSEVSAPAMDNFSAALDETLERGVELIAFEAGPHLDGAMADQLIKAQVAGVRVVDFVDFYAALTGRVPLDLVDKSWILGAGLKPHSRSMLSRLRRLTSALSSAFLLIVLSPLLLLIAVLVWCESGRPIIFAQQRLGLFRRPFTLFKFRSMVQDAERDGPRWAERGDARVTRVGRFLRRTRLDELPQLLNVVRGDIQLIGPRPIRQYAADRLAEQSPYYDLRFLYPPGLTGWPQVVGHYGMTDEEHIEKLEMEFYYFRYAGLIDDLYILLKTVQVVARLSGV